LGIGNFTTNAPWGISMPQKVGTNANWRAIAAGRHTVALRADGALWTWGLNNHGQLGIGTFTTNAPGSPHSGFGISTPQQVGTNTNWGPP
jgi:alpha-tubulin suppressor-like RCC1 family protein